VDCVFVCFRRYVGYIVRRAFVGLYVALAILFGVGCRTLFGALVVCCPPEEKKEQVNKK
jgi:hypothetical protein